MCLFKKNTSVPHIRVKHPSPSHSLIVIQCKPTDVMLCARFANESRITNKSTKRLCREHTHTKKTVLFHRLKAMLVRPLIGHANQPAPPHQHQPKNKTYIYPYTTPLGVRRRLAQAYIRTLISFFSKKSIYILQQQKRTLLARTTRAHAPGKKTTPQRMIANVPLVCRLCWACFLTRAP